MEKKQRKINELIIHCTATEYLIPVTVEDVRTWHIERGFIDIGYHFLIDRNGNIHAGRALSIPGAHCKGHNQHSIGICYVGGISNGVPTDTRNLSQRLALRLLIAELCCRYCITNICGHNEYANKACPCFDAKKEYSYFLKK